MEIQALRARICTKISSYIACGKRQSKYVGLIGVGVIGVGLIGVGLNGVGLTGVSLIGVGLIGVGVIGVGLIGGFVGLIGVRLVGGLCARAFTCNTIWSSESHARRGASESHARRASQITIWALPLRPACFAVQGFF